MKKIGDVLKQYIEENKKNPLKTTSQALGFQIATQLENKKSLPMFIRICKQERTEVIEQALRFAVDYPNCTNKTAMFLWKIKQLKNEFKIVSQENKRAKEILINILTNNKTALIPSTSTYLVVSRLFNSKGIKQLNKLRNKNLNIPNFIILDSTKEFKTYINKIPIQLENLIKKYWPGNLIIGIQPERNLNLPKEVINKRKKFAYFQYPSTSFLKNIIKDMKEPLIANIPLFGNNDKTGLDRINHSVIDNVDIAIKDPKIKIEEILPTVINYESKNIKILFQGNIILQ